MACGCGAKAGRSATRQVTRRIRNVSNRNLSNTSSQAASSNASRRRVIKRPLR